MQELRCEHKLHATHDDKWIEVSCLSRLCGKRAGVVVLHRFDLETGEMTTRIYRSPTAASDHPSPDERNP